MRAGRGWRPSPDSRRRAWRRTPPGSRGPRARPGSAVPRARSLPGAPRIEELVGEPLARALEHVHQLLARELAVAGERLEGKPLRIRDVLVVLPHDDAGRTYHDVGAGIRVGRHHIRLAFANAD